MPHDLLLRDPAQAAMRRTFNVWIKSLLRRKAGSHSIEDIDRINDLLEADTMLAERIESWFEERYAKGFTLGIQQGRIEGRVGPVAGGSAGVKSLLRRKVGLHRSNIQHDIDRINDLLDSNTLLAERLETWFEETYVIGLATGYAIGFQQGRIEEGESRLLAKLLERRFGPLPQAVTERLAAATEAQLEAWGEAVLSAPSLEAIFGEGRQ